ncbi:sensor histidine kinase [Ktedonosporobacter rubrisoli]|uniref:histidine kinase n=1 Tax=Ktedonosporobacter rubrisoli TaxID=2509675 RepID=A0A4V0YZC9_KTERU|nr:sensor histidine kinase [Ktedonosporobacter rubrisoli]QBD79281.1 sensor histidine kinase [Ktedonosporobacter rubrisoli]
MSTKEVTTLGTMALERQQSQSVDRWTWWLLPKPIDLVSTSLYIGVLIPYFYSFCYRGMRDPLWHVGLMIGCIAALLSIERLECRFYGEIPPPLPASLLLAVRIGIIGVISCIEHFAFSPFLYLIIPFLARCYFKGPACYWLAALAWIAYLAQRSLHGWAWLYDLEEVHYFVAFSLGLIFALTMAHAMRKEQISRECTEQLLSELENSHQQLKVYSEQAAELAATRERNRMAREIHDTLGHYLTVINVQLEKAQAFRAKRPDEADQAINDARRLATEALQDVRHSVSALRTSPQLPAFNIALQELVDHVSSEHCRVELKIMGKAEDFSAQRLMALYRAVQEGLTNMQKHAKATRAEIAVHFSLQNAKLVISDNGRGFDPMHLRYNRAEREGGYGLLGIQERLELIGGGLQIESKPGQGTSLSVIIPNDPLHIVAK